MRSLTTMAACLWLIGGVPSLVRGQPVNVTAVDDYYAQPQQTSTYYSVSQQDTYYTQPQQTGTYPQAADPYFLPEELDQMLAPIALYPDSLLSQVLMAATYPLEIVQADRWVKATAHLNADEAARALELESWDASVKSLVNFPDVLAMLSDRLDWTQQLGDAFLSQPQDVADSIQRLRASAWNSGNLGTTEQQVVYVTQQAPTPIIVIEPAVPDIIYVPVYDPVVVYGYWPYPAYPPYRYYPHGYVVTNFISFSFGRHCGFAWGYAWGHWDWDHRDIRIDVNINIGRNSYINPTRYTAYAYPNSTWRHDPVHRRTVPYRSERLAQSYGGSSIAQTVQSREDYRGRSSSILLDRLGSPELARLDDRNRSDNGRVAREPSSRSSISGSGSDSQRDAVSRTPPGTDTEVARDRLPTIDRGRSPAVDRDRTTGRNDDRVAYVPAQPVGRMEREPRPFDPPATPRVTREPGRIDSTPREPVRVETRDRDGRLEGTREAARKEPVTRHPSRPEFTPREPARPETIRREPTRVEPSTREPLRIDPIKRDPIRIEPQIHEPLRIDPVRRDPIRIEPQKREPVRIDPIRREPSRLEPKTSTIRKPPSSSGLSRSPGSIFEGVTRSGREASSHSDRGKTSRSTKVGSGSTRKPPQTPRR